MFGDVTLDSGLPETVGLYGDADFILRVTRTPEEEDALTRVGVVSYDAVLPEYEGFVSSARMSARGFGDWLCKIWRAVLKIVDSVVDTVTDIVTKVGGAALRLLTGVIKVVADGVGSLFGSTGGKILLLAGAGLGLWWLMGRRKKEDATPRASLEPRYLNIGPVEREPIDPYNGGI